MNKNSNPLLDVQEYQEWDRLINNVNPQLKEMWERKNLDGQTLSGLLEQYATAYTASGKLWWTISPLPMLVTMIVCSGWVMLFMVWMEKTAEPRRIFWHALAYLCLAVVVTIVCSIIVMNSVDKKEKVNDEIKRAARGSLSRFKQAVCDLCPKGGMESAFNLMVHTSLEAIDHRFVVLATAKERAHESFLIQCHEPRPNPVTVEATIASFYDARLAYANMYTAGQQFDGLINQGSVQSHFARAVASIEAEGKSEQPAKQT